MEHNLSTDKKIDRIVTISVFIFIGTVTAIFIALILLSSISRYNDNKTWEDKDYCKQCPICGNPVDIRHSSELWDITCDHKYGGCGLRTGNYIYVDHLINDWNKLCNYNQ